MSEVIRKTEARESPLREAQREAGAKFEERAGAEVPASYGDVTAEYEAVRSGPAGLIDLSPRGLIEVSGSEAEQFLNGLITNDVKALKDGECMNAAFPNVQGRLLAFARVLRVGGRFLFDTEAVTREKVLKTLERFTLAGDFRVADFSGETALLSVQGTGATDVVSAALGREGAARVGHNRIFAAKWNDKDLIVIRATHTAEDGLDLFVNIQEAASLWERLVSCGARPVGSDALEVLRVEAGVPRFGVDVDETNVVLEAGADDAVSFTKGCYVGQEIIARIHWRGHVAKRLAGLIVDEGVAVRPGHNLRGHEGRDVGRVTSVVRSPRLGQTIALGIVKYNYLAPGTEVTVTGEGAEGVARVAELPFVRGSWYEVGE